MNTKTINIQVLALLGDGVFSLYIREKILELGINVKFNKELGKNLLIEELQDEFDAIFVAIGANIPAKMGVEGDT